MDIDLNDRRLGSLIITCILWATLLTWVLLYHPHRESLVKRAKIEPVTPPNLKQIRRLFTQPNENPFLDTIAGGQYDEDDKDDDSDKENKPPKKKECLADQATRYVAPLVH